MAASGATGARQAPSPVATQLFLGECIHSFSANGEWAVSELDVAGSMRIHNLLTGDSWTYMGSGDGDGYDLATGRDVSDDGTVTAEVDGVPSYWKNGKWTPLPGARGGISAVVGGITPDGSVIAGSMSSGQSFRTNPCIWRRQADGTYGNPEWLPQPSSGGGAQYINTTGISDDGRTVAVSLRSGSGFNNYPCVYKLGDDGKWTFRQFNASLMGEDDVMPVSPGSYRGPQAPNYEDYMTPEQLDEFFTATGYAWLDDLYAQGMNDDEVFVEGILYAAEFMSAANKLRYLPLARAFADAYLPWAKAMAEYQAALDAIADKIIDFEFNNVFISPDGKYLYSTAYRTIINDINDPEYGTVKKHAPVRFDTATGETVIYPWDYDALICCVTGDYSVLAWDYDMDAHLYRPAYIFPGLSTDAYEIQDYWLDYMGNEAAYEWFEQTLYQEVLIGFTASGAYRWDDAWSVGKPVATPDMSLWCYGTSTLYWSVPPSVDLILASFVFNPADFDEDHNGESGIEASVEDGTLPGELEIYTLSGIKSGNSTQGLQPGIYVVKSGEGVRKIKI